MDRGARWAVVHGVAGSRTRLSNFPLTFHFHSLEKEMATHSSVLALKNPKDRGAWWASFSGVAQSRTRLKRLSSSSIRIKCYTLLVFNFCLLARESEALKQISCAT